MPEVFEIEIFSHNRLGFEVINSILTHNDIRYCIDKVYAMDNWSYENLTELKHQKELDKFLDKIGIINVRLSDGTRCGYQAEKLSDNIYHTSLWFSLKHFQNLISHTINPENIHIYNVLSSYIELHTIELGIIVAGMGVEVKISYDSSVPKMINTSNNVSRWIVNSIE